MSYLYDELTPRTPDQLRNAMMNPRHALYIENQKIRNEIMAKELTLEELQIKWINETIEKIQQSDTARRERELQKGLKDDEAYLESVTKMAERYRGPQAKTVIRDRIGILEDKNRELEKEISEIKEKLKVFYIVDQEYQTFQETRANQFIENLKKNNKYRNSDGQIIEVKLDEETARKQLVGPSFSKLLDINPEFSADIKKNIAEAPERRETVLKQTADLMGAKADFLYEIKAAGLVAEQMVNKEKPGSENQESSIDTTNWSREILRAIAQNKNKEGLIPVSDNSATQLTQKALTVTIESEPLLETLKEKETELAENNKEVTELRRLRDFTPKP